MTPFVPTATGDVVAVFSEAEVDTVVQLATEVQGLLAQSDLVNVDSVSGRALERLLPDAYPDDAEKAAEFRRFTRSDLIGRKTRNAAVLRSSFTEGEFSDGRMTVRLTPETVQAWLRSLTDLRLTLAAALGIENDGDSSSLTDDDLYAGDVYDWLGYVQESLLEALL